MSFDTNSHQTSNHVYAKEKSTHDIAATVWQNRDHIGSRRTHLPWGIYFFPKSRDTDQLDRLLLPFEFAKLSVRNLRSIYELRSGACNTIDTFAFHGQSRLPGQDIINLYTLYWYIHTRSMLILKLQ